MVKLWLTDYHVVTLTVIQVGNRSPSWYQDGCSILRNLSFETDHFRQSKL